MTSATTTATAPESQIPSAGERLNGACTVRRGAGERYTAVAAPSAPATRTATRTLWPAGWPER
jgi:hypothetical protein